MNPQTPSSTSADAEIAKYEFRKGAQQFLSGGATASSETTTNTSVLKPVIKKQAGK
jgi:hypothetical protein